MSYSVRSLASGASTMVTLTSIVPCDGTGGTYATRAIASTGAFATGTVYAEVYGTCGQAMTMEFKLPVP